MTRTVRKTSLFKLGIRQKIWLSLLSALLLPLCFGLFAGVSLEATEQMTPGIAMSLAAALLIPFAICGTVLAWVISSTVLLPLRDLKKAADAIQTGCFDYALTVQSHDEMGDFCRAFEAMRQQLQVSLHKQAALEDSRKELIASISHDLRTPLSSIKGYLEALNDGIARDEAKTARYMTIIRNKTDHLERLIESLFQYSQLDFDNPADQRISLDAKELLDTILIPFEMEFAESDIRFETQNELPPCFLDVNPGQIAQVFDNLIYNAKTYTEHQPNGVIRVEAQIQPNHLIVQIADNGTGIAATDLPYIFDYFYRSEKSRSRQHGGAGLGLALTKKIIENHSGTITSVSIPGQQTVFSFTLPLVFPYVKLR
ncbi:HAMP domain-containing sensor histidine kinase [Saccharibacillus sacchari]|uniref:HAMP domain-containing sensor histidine kinase n=1 Tax=Saccharibacillus sacchari TaxID=456493 RepID=A0ACC6PJM2_9BACL